MTKFTIEDLRDIAYRGSYDDLERELALHLLASMEQTPVYLRPFGDDGETFVACDDDDERAIPLYAAPQLPQPAVPDALERLRSIVADPKALPRRKEWISGQQYSYVLLENVEGLVEEACRAAMLQGADQPQNSQQNIPKNIPDGWVAVPVDMTPEMMRAVQFNSELGAYASANLSGAYSLFREFWDVAIAAAPDFREISNSSTEHFRGNAETSTKCPKCGGRGSYHCPQMLGTVECECTLPAVPQQEVR